MPASVVQRRPCRRAALGASGRSVRRRVLTSRTATTITWPRARAHRFVTRRLPHRQKARQLQHKAQQHGQGTAGAIAGELRPFLRPPLHRRTPRMTSAAATRLPLQQVPPTRTLRARRPPPAGGSSSQVDGPPGCEVSSRPRRRAAMRPPRTTRMTTRTRTIPLLLLLLPRALAIGAARGWRTRRHRRWITSCSG